ncbi:MAG: WD40/YVTN/BNR-like repeat-containing protein [Kordiimonas sp.]
MKTRKTLSGIKMVAVAAALMAGTALQPAAIAQDSENPFAGLKLRNIGPALQSGRISDFAFYPGKAHEYLVATSSGNLWKTNNNGTTWTPMMENAGSYAIGVVELDPSNENTIWVGTGENNAQRSVANGDGVYKSIDGGKTFENVGLKDSGHIGKIWINPDNSDHVLVAAQGPLWNEGGDRGLYETKDGGATWNRILDIDEHTGANEFVVDPNNPNNIIVSTWQRRRHVWTMISGGPGSGVHRTTDGGKTWSKVTSGLPGKSDLGRIGLVGAPSAPNIVYAQVATDSKGSGIYRTDDFGLTWKKQSGHMSNAPFYYNEIVVDPKNPNRLYAPETFTKISEDAGKTWRDLSLKARHVDDHAVWIDPTNTDHIFIGGDGGVYESWDRGANFRFVRNLPITQFYRVQPDNAAPFYNVCGGTQDNNSQCGPSRTTSVHGITTADWSNVLGGDGFEAVIDPNDPNVVYAQYQYGGLARVDMRTTEKTFIAPQEGAGENRPKWNWNSPLIISPHKAERIYYAGEKVWRSDDRGDNWTVVSPDLTRQIDRNALEVMGRVWSVDAVGKNNSTSIYGSLIGLSESTLKEGLIYAGSDDGIISVTEDGGQNWTSVRKFKGVPDMSLIEDVQASLHDENVVFAVVDNHKRGDFKPYVMKSTNKGKSWKLISGDLPERGTVHTIVQDHVDPNLLFVGTEYGLFFTQDGGDNWHQMKGGFPTISVRDVEIQRRESDLVVGTFGRGIYILDDYSPLRFKAADVTANEATLFPIKDALQYVQSSQYGGRRKGSQGDQFYSADNPAFGATFTYYLNDSYKTKADIRKAAERETAKAGGDTPYPAWDVLRAEEREEKPQLIFTVTDDDGTVVRRLTAPATKGLSRLAWDLRLDAPNRVSFRRADPNNPYDGDPVGIMAMPGDYNVSISVRHDDVLKELVAPTKFTVKGLDNSPEITKDRAANYAFQKKSSALFRAVDTASAAMGDMNNRIKHIDAALLRTSGATEAQKQELIAIKDAMRAVSIQMNGDRTIASRNEPTPRSIRGRIGSIVFFNWSSQAPITGGNKDAYEIAATQFADALASLKAVDARIAALEAGLDAMDAPWTPGRLPNWTEK